MKYADSKEADACDLKACSKKKNKKKKHAFNVTRKYISSNVNKKAEDWMNGTVFMLMVRWMNVVFL